MTREEMAKEWVREFAQQLPGLFDFHEGTKCFLAGFDAGREFLVKPLEKLREDIICNADDVVWVGASETACERITSIINDNWGEHGDVDALKNQVEVWKSRAEKAEARALAEAEECGHWKSRTEAAEKDLEQEMLANDKMHAIKRDEIAKLKDRSEAAERSVSIAVEALEEVMNQAAVSDGEWAKLRAKWVFDRCQKALAEMRELVKALAKLRIEDNSLTRFDEMREKVKGAVG